SLIVKASGGVRGVFRTFREKAIREIGIAREPQVGGAQTAPFEVIDGNRYVRAATSGAADKRHGFFRRVGAKRIAVGGRNLGARYITSQDDVDRARCRARPVDRGGAIFENLDALNQRDRKSVQIDERRGRSIERARR